MNRSSIWQHITIKNIQMKRIITIALAAMVVLAMTSCGSSSKETKSALGDKKVELEKLKKQQDDLNKKITALEDEIAKLDTSAGAKPKLVAVATVGSDTFAHYIDLQGKIDAQNIAMVAPKNQGGVVKSVNVKQGQVVRKGQLILKLDDAIARQQVAGAQSQYDLAKTNYDRRKRVFDQGVGAEIQVIQAKADADAALSQLRAAQENLDMSNVYAEISGTIDEVNVRPGEFFSAQSAANPETGIRIVNTSDLKVLVQVPENYLGKVKQGSQLQVTLPESGKKFTSRAMVVGNLIDLNTRTFYVEGSVPSGSDYRPNQIAMVNIRDYALSNAITIPVNTIQNDEKGKYVIVAVKEGDKLVARKRPVIIGEIYGGQLEIKSGLKAGDVLVIEGFQNLYDSQLITTAVQ
jgi:RND family efflux transporter MFP subunit